MLSTPVLLPAFIARSSSKLGTAAKLHRELPQEPRWMHGSPFCARDSQRVLDRAVRWFIAERGVVCLAPASLSCWD